MATRKMSPARIALTAAVPLIVLALVPVALAGKGGKGGHGAGGGGGTGSGGGSVALVMVSDANGDALPNWGDSITYTVSTSATTQPYVATNCYQGTTLVGSTSAGYYPSYAWPDAQVMPLKSQRWTSGAADCTARLYSMDGGSQTVLATLGFHVNA